MLGANIFSSDHIASTIGTAAAGAIAGWFLKSLADFFAWRVKEKRQHRQAAFSFLKTYKALGDYDRATTYFRKGRTSVDEFEPKRAMLEARLLEESDRTEPATLAALEILAAMSPTNALELDRALRRINDCFNGRLQRAIQEDGHLRNYSELLMRSDRLVATALIALEKATKRVALRSGWLDYLRVSKWLRDFQGKGQHEFDRAMDDEREVRERVWTS